MLGVGLDVVLFVGDEVSDIDRLRQYLRRLPDRSVVVHTNKGVGKQVRALITGKHKDGGLILAEFVATGGHKPRPHQAAYHAMLHMLAPMKAQGGDAWVVLCTSDLKASPDMVRAARTAKALNLPVKVMRP